MRRAEREANQKAEEGSAKHLWHRRCDRNGATTDASKRWLKQPATLFARAACGVAGMNSTEEDEGIPTISQLTDDPPRRLVVAWCVAGSISFLPLKNKSYCYQFYPTEF